MRTPSNRDNNQSASIDPQHSNWLFNRWGNDEDCNLYRHILELVSNNIITINELLSLQRPISLEFKRVLWSIAQETQWRSPTLLLLKRIKRIFNDHRFSVRQIIRLRRIIRKQYKYKDLDYNTIRLRFPGKSIESITDMCNQILVQKRKM